MYSSDINALNMGLPIAPIATHASLVEVTNNNTSDTTTSNDTFQDGEHVTMPIDGKYTIIKYRWIWIMLVRVKEGYDTSTPIRSGYAGYYSVVNHVLMSKHTVGIIDDNITHGNHVFRPNITRGNTLSSHDIRWHRFVEMHLQQTMS